MVNNYRFHSGIMLHQFRFGNTVYYNTLKSAYKTLGSG